MNRIIEVIDTRITDKWGVNWNELETVRDFLQNFYDANPIESIVIKFNGNQVSISAPAEFDYNELLYMGSDKSNDSDTIGEYGEGFKASVLNALRNWGCEVEVKIANRKLRYYFDAKKIGKSEKRVVWCEISEIDNVAGTTLVVNNCAPNLLREFQFGLNHFYFENHPLIGSNLCNTYQKDIFIYESKDKKDGFVFYKNLMRSRIELPIVIVCNREYKIIDNKIKHDRDRKAFNDDVLLSLMKLVFKNFSNYQLKSTIQLLNFWWGKGHKILSSICEGRHHENFDISFPENYFANDTTVSQYEDMRLKGEIKTILSEFKKSNYISCPQYMTRLGMKSPKSLAQERLKERDERVKNIHSRELTICETNGITILAFFIKEISVELHDKFNNAKYTTGESKEILGELKSTRRHNEQHVFLEFEFFQLSFGDALAILMHEWAHIYGSDGSRTFSDALTHFIALILKSTLR